MSSLTFTQLLSSEADLIIFQPTLTRRILVLLFPGTGNLHYNFSTKFDNLMVRI